MLWGPTGFGSTGDATPSSGSAWGCQTKIRHMHAPRRCSCRSGMQAGRWSISPSRFNRPASCQTPGCGDLPVPMSILLASAVASMSKIDLQNLSDPAVQ